MTGTGAQSHQSLRELKQKRSDLKQSNLKALYGTHIGHVKSDRTNLKRDSPMRVKIVKFVPQAGSNTTHEKTAESVYTVNVETVTQLSLTALKALLSWKRNCNMTTVIHETIEKVRCRKLSEEVWLAALFENEDLPYHKCHIDKPWLTEMALRESDDGPLYWCPGCGYSPDKGISMAIRLNEVKI